MHAPLGNTAFKLDQKFLLNFQYDVQILNMWHNENTVIHI